MSTRNVELLEQVMRHIEDHPEQHQQSDWFSECGTAACFAGWACLLSGWASVGRSPARVLSPDGVVAGVREVAEDLLGLTGNETDVLFHAGNRRNELALMVKDLVNGETLRQREQYLDQPVFW